MLEVVFVGTGDAFGSGGRRQTAILVRDGRGTLLLDCGPGTLTGLKALGIDPLEIDAIALSHFHGDHIGGVPFLMLDYQYEHARERPLTIFGPPGVEDRLDRVNQAFNYPDDGRAYELRYREFSIGSCVELGPFRVTPEPAHHHPETIPHMLRVETADRSLFFTGDTGWHEELPERVGDVDLFISECVFLEERFEFHMSAERLDRERARFRCRRTVLTHLGSEVLGDLDRIPFEPVEDGTILTF